jgi:N-methylhydantoinase A
MMHYFIGTDIGGTFTDVVVLDEGGKVTVAKAPSTPPNFAQGLMDALAEAAAQHELPLGELLRSTRLFSHGCTVATNTLINRSGCRVGLITTQGFEETLFIMRGSAYCQGLPVEYWYRKPQNERPFDIVALDHIVGVTERIDRTGGVVVALNEEQARAAADLLVNQRGCDALTVCFLWSFMNPTHEEKARRIIAEMFPECTVSISSEIAAVPGEYERFGTAALNTYLRPEVEAYVHDLRQRLVQEGLAAPVLLMQANGGLIPWEETAWQAVRMLQSGPTGGVIAGKIIGDLIGSGNVITTDMGGTSYDISLVTDGKLNYAAKSYHARQVVATPMVDIESIGAGGGSIAYIDQGVMKVGPQSAGADPGPVCYGKGGSQPTVTDANLVLGYLNPHYFIGGRLKLNVEIAREAIRKQLAEPLGMETVEAAYGVHRIVNAHMADATRFYVLNRGYDPRDFDLLLFGGAAGLHATAIGEELGVKSIIIPLAGLATVLSAFGIANSDVVRLYSASASMPLAAEKMEELESIYGHMEQRAGKELARDGFSAADISTTRIASIRYHLQLTEVDVEPLPSRLEASSAEEISGRFDRRYAELYGESAGYKEAGRDVISQFVRAEARTPKVQLSAARSSDSESDRLLKERREAYFPQAGGYVPTRVFDGDGLGAGSQIAGPAILEMVGTTVVVPPGYRADLDAYRNIHLRREG